MAAIGTLLVLGSLLAFLLAGIALIYKGIPGMSRWRHRRLSGVLGAAGVLAFLGGGTIIPLPPLESPPPKATRLSGVRGSTKSINPPLAATAPAISSAPTRADGRGVPPGPGGAKPLPPPPSAPSRPAPTTFEVVTRGRSCDVVGAVATATDGRAAVCTLDAEGKTKRWR